jgi:hypothetical protein
MLYLKYCLPVTGLRRLFLVVWAIVVTVLAVGGILGWWYTFV